MKRESQRTKIWTLKIFINLCNEKHVDKYMKIGIQFINSKRRKVFLKLNV